MALPVELLGAIELPGAIVLPLVMPVSGFSVLSEGFMALDDVVLLDGLLMALPMLLWARATGPSIVRAQAAAMKKRDIGIYSCCGRRGMIPVAPIWAGIGLRG
jgi:hypothetical protein